MGFDKNGVKLLLHAKRLGVKFDRVATIGRQMLYVKEKEMKKLIAESGVEDSDGGKSFGLNTYAEAFLRMLGAEHIDSFDASSYEEASIIHDMNQPLPGELFSKYSVVIDGGSLEHIFNFPTAIKNCMNLIEKSGYYLGITPANNFLGHGFYQFSPELYYRIFSQVNGFKVKKMYLYADHRRANFYEVRDPLDLKQRVIMANSSPSYLFILAQKTGDTEVFKTVPQQSDYEHIVWTQAAPDPVSRKKKVTNSRVTKLKRILRDTYQRHCRPLGNSNPQAVRKIKL